MVCYAAIQSSSTVLVTPFGENSKNGHGKSYQRLVGNIASRR